MNTRVQFRLVAHKDTGLKAAPNILARELKAGLAGVGKSLLRSAQSRMRKDTGETQRSLQVVIQGRGGNYSLVVFSELIQAFVDAYGLHRGVFAPFQQGTRIYNWAFRRARGIDNKVVRGGETPVGPHRPSRTVRRIKTTKRIQKAGTGTQTYNSPRYKTKQAEAKRLAFLIARAIYRRGLKASHWNRKALEANKRNITLQMQNALIRATNKINNS